MQVGSRDSLKTAPQGYATAKGEHICRVMPERRVCEIHPLATVRLRHSLGCASCRADTETVFMPWCATISALTIIPPIYLLNGHLLPKIGIVNISFEWEVFALIADYKPLYREPVSPQSSTEPSNALFVWPGLAQSFPSIRLAVEYSYQKW
jgi:hypothetical protein